MSRPRLVRAAVLIGAALALGAAPPPEEMPRPSAWNRFVDGARHALFDRENPRTTGKQSPEREKTAKPDKPVRGQAPARAGSVSGQAKFQRTLPRDSQVRPASAVASDDEPSDDATDMPADEFVDEPADTLPPVVRSTRQPRALAKPVPANSPAVKNPASKPSPDKLSPGKTNKGGAQKPRTVSEYMAKERP